MRPSTEVTRRTYGKKFDTEDTETAVYCPNESLQLPSFLYYSTSICHYTHAKQFYQSPKDVFHFSVWFHYTQIVLHSSPFPLASLTTTNNHTTTPQHIADTRPAAATTKTTLTRTPLTNQHQTWHKAPILRLREMWSFESVLDEVRYLFSSTLPGEVVISVPSPRLTSHSQPLTK